MSSVKGYTMKRRQNRSGQLAQKGPDRWLIRWSDGRDPGTGKWITRSKVVQGSREEAEAELAKVRVAKAEGAYLPPSRVTVAEALRRWLEALENSSQKKRSARTLADYRMIATKRIAPVLGGVLVHRLRGAEIEALYAGLRKHGGRRKSGLAPRTIEYTHAVLRACLRWAAGKGELLVQSPMRHVDPPTQESSDRRANGLSAEQVRTFLNAANDTEHFALFALLFGTGMRPGEALALRWSDVDLERGTARIARSLSRPGGRYDCREPKTKGSKRQVPIAAPLVRALRRHRAVQRERQVALGAAWDRELELVFPNATGGYADETAIYRYHFRKLAALAGLPAGTRLYDARHTFASLALTSGVPVHEVSRILGHSKVTMTLDTYAHLLPERASAATDAVGAAIFAG